MKKSYIIVFIMILMNLSLLANADKSPPEKFLDRFLKAYEESNAEKMQQITDTKKCSWIFRQMKAATDAGVRVEASLNITNIRTNNQDFVVAADFACAESVGQNSGKWKESLVFYINKTKDGLKLVRIDNPRVRKRNALAYHSMALMKELEIATGKQNWAAVAKLFNVNKTLASQIAEGDKNVFKNADILWLHNVIINTSIGMRLKRTSFDGDVVVTNIEVFDINDKDKIRSKRCLYLYADESIKSKEKQARNKSSEKFHFGKKRE